MKSFYRALTLLVLIFGVVSTAQATYCLHDKVFFRTDELNGCKFPVNIFSHQVSHGFNLNQPTNQILHAAPGEILASVDDQMQKLSVTISPNKSGNIDTKGLFSSRYAVTAGQKFFSGSFVRIDNKRYFMFIVQKYPGQSNSPGAILFVDENSGSLYSKNAIDDAADKTDIDFAKQTVVTDPADMKFAVDKHVEPVAQKNSYALVFNSVNGMFLVATDQSVEGAAMLSRPVNYQIQPGAIILWRAVRIQIITATPNDIAYKVIGLIGI